jgi:hypothetical protein
MSRRSIRSANCAFDAIACTSGLWAKLACLARRCAPPRTKREQRILPRACHGTEIRSSDRAKIKPRQDKKVRIGNLGAGLQFSRKANIKAAWFARKVDLLGRA